MAMLTYSLRTDAAPRARFDRDATFDRKHSHLPPKPMLLPIDQPRLAEQWEQRRNSPAWPGCDHHISDGINQAVEIFPSDIVKRRAFAWDGMAVELVQATR